MQIAANNDVVSLKEIFFGNILKSKIATKVSNNKNCGNLFLEISLLTKF